MRDVAESDWKLFKKMLPQWQERYMEKLIGRYVEMLNGDSEASSRFWALEERINRDKLSSGVLANDIRRSTMHYEIANLLSDAMEDAANRWMRRGGTRYGDTGSPGFRPA